MRWILGTALAASLAFSGAAWSQDCAATIEGNDQLQFSLKEITVSSSCDAFELTLKHVGTLAVTVMGHNWVLTSTPDFEAVAMAGMAAGADNDYIPPGDQRVIAHTKLVGGGEETSVSFDASQLTPGGDYTFFCSFPGHYAIMQGKLIVE
jgi:azurin